MTSIQIYWKNDGFLKSVPNLPEAYLQRTNEGIVQVYISVEPEKLNDLQLIRGWLLSHYMKREELIPAYNKEILNRKDTIIFKKHQDCYDYIAVEKKELEQRLQDDKELKIIWNESYPLSDEWVVICLPKTMNST